MTKTKYRIQPSYNDRWTFERCDGRRTMTGGGEYWRVIDTCDDKTSAEKRLAKAESRP